MSCPAVNPTGGFVAGSDASLAARIAVGLAAGILSLLAAACAVGGTVHYYAINRPPLVNPPAKVDGPVLMVAQIATSDALQDGRINYRSGSNNAGAYEYQRWSERPDVMVRDLLVQALRATGHYREVEPTPRIVPGDYLIRGKLFEFSEVDSPAIQTRVSLRVEVVARKSGLVVWSRNYDRNEPVQGKAIRDVVASLDHNLQQVIADSTSGIDTFLSKPSER